MLPGSPARLSTPVGEMEILGTCCPFILEEGPRGLYPVGWTVTSQGNSLGANGGMGRSGTINFLVPWLN